jgi:hypothetical protein
MGTAWTTQALVKLASAFDGRGKNKFRMQPLEPRTTG